MSSSCRESCWAQPLCCVCGRPKVPIGRSVPPGTRMCDCACPGYQQEPYPGHAWSREEAEAEAAWFERGVE